MQEHKSQLNGVRFYSSKVQDAPIRVGVYFQAGGIYQGKGQEGISHLLEHIIMSPNLVTEKPPDTISAYTCYEYIYFHINSYDSNNFLDNTWPRFASLVNSPKFNSHAIQQEAKSIRAELASIKNDPIQAGDIMLNDYVLFGRETDEIVGCVEGDPDNIDKFSAEELRNHHLSHMKSPSSITITGGLETSLAVKKIMLDAFKLGSKQKPKSPTTNLSAWQLRPDHIDKLLVGQSVNSYVGIAWKDEYTTARQYLMNAIFLNSITNTRGNLYRRLRDSEEGIYRLEPFSQAINQQVCTYTISSSVAAAAKNDFFTTIKNYLSREDQILQDIEKLLDYYRQTTNTIYDGTFQIFNTLNWLQRIDMLPSEYIKLIDSLSPKEIFENGVFAYDKAVTLCLS